MALRIVIAVAAALGAIALSLPLAAFVFLSIGLPQVADHVAGPPAAPDIVGPLDFDPEPVRTAEAWRDRRAPAIRTVLADTVFGRTPPLQSVAIAARETLVEAPAGGRLEALDLAIGDDGRRLLVTVAIPPGEGPFPVVLQANPCGPRLTFEDERAPARRAWRSSSLCGQDSAVAAWLARYIFGDRIFSPPVERILERGYAYATFHESELAADDPVLAREGLATLTPADAPAQSRPGAIAAWAWGFAHVAQALETDARFDADGIVVIGHSRRGKAVLWAAALSEAIDVVISHQSGTGGATLSRSSAGESVLAVAMGFPHWFAPAFTSAGEDVDALPFDQHMLVALTAPRPLLLSNADRDEWSDPHGTLRAAIGAAPIYALLGADAFSQERFSQADFSRDLVVTMRRGRHGVRSDDWERFLDFADAHLRPD